jgi:hypothetical protein
LKVLNPTENGDHAIDYRVGIVFLTQDGKIHEVPGWDLIIAHPPCTYLSNAGNRYFNVE